jgi:hypothetical protein
LRSEQGVKSDSSISLSPSSVVVNYGLKAEHFQEKLAP